MTALLLDEMLSGTIAEQLRAHDIDAIAVVEDVDLIGTSDRDLLAHATSHERVLVTANIADFVELATQWRAAGQEHGGLVFVTNRAFPQNRAFIGSIVSALIALVNCGGLPSPGMEMFLRPVAGEHD